MLPSPYAEPILSASDSDGIPAAAAMVMSALEAGAAADEDRRELGRVSYRTTTTLRLFRDQPSAPQWRLYTRDINHRGMGFITPHRLPLGYGGIVILPDENGRPTSVHCTLSRCREAAPGWFEGCLHFNREQPHWR